MRRKAFEDVRGKAKMDPRLPPAGMTEKLNVGTTNAANGFLPFHAFRLTFHGNALPPASSLFTPLLSEGTSPCLFHPER